MNKPREFWIDGRDMECFINIDEYAALKSYESALYILIDHARETPEVLVEWDKKREEVKSSILKALEYK